MVEERTKLTHHVVEPEMIRLMKQERIILFLSGLFLLINTISLSILQNTSPLETWLPFIVWTICAIVGHTLLNRHVPDRNPFIFTLPMMLTGWGLIAINRLLPIFSVRQSIWLALSLGVMLVVAIFPQPLDWLRRYRYTLLISGLALLLATIVFGTNPSNYPTAPRLWLGISGIYFQPSEALKIILVAFLASYLAEYIASSRTTIEPPNRRGLFTFSPRILGPILLMWGLCIVILVWQRDLGTAILFFGVFILLMYVASGSLTILIVGFILTIMATLVAYQLFSVVQLRIDIWINPWPESNTRAYQIVQSLQAIASGGFFGQGIGQGLPIYIPVAHSDFIFAVIAEEWGLLGIVTLVGIITVFFTNSLKIAFSHHNRPFYLLLAAGFALLIAAQSILIIGGVLKLIPLTGVTLPFVSYGGSSLMTSFFMVGLLLRLSSFEAK